MNYQRTRRVHERGGVSIFIVILTALLVTVVTTSFAQLMVRNQQQASANDLSQSAYDSALAGVEDAKRALVQLLECEKSGNTACVNNIRAALNSDRCDSLESADVVEFENGEVPIGSSAEQNQAYTCVKVQLNTPDYRDDGLGPGIPVVVPLMPEDGEEFDTVHLWWFTKQDLDRLSGGGQETPEMPPTVVGDLPLTDSENWPAYAPALMRTQLIQFTKGSINLNSFNNRETPNARTLFLYPQDLGSTLPLQLSFADDKRREDGAVNKPVQASCNDNFTAYNGYACYVEISLPDIAGTREAYLQLQTYYQQYTSYKVQLSDGNSSVNLDEVQPRVDSTGRASSLFRRVEANVTLRNDGIQLQYPDAALSLSGGLCKNFFVTNNANQYSADCNVEE